ncbi:hypothetical protein XH93_10160 [Bradyrhizobium sp. CCBAU 51753]|nr:hypothetical protein XH93_10160 [Bradyrhizobium sp. CCBAU 51753]
MQTLKDIIFGKRSERLAVIVADQLALGRDLSGGEMQTKHSFCCRQAYRPCQPQVGLTALVVETALATFSRKFLAN